MELFCFAQAGVWSKRRLDIMMFYEKMYCFCFDLKTQLTQESYQSSFSTLPSHEFRGVKLEVVCKSMATISSLLVVFK